MKKLVLLAVVGLLGFCLPALAQTSDESETLTPEQLRITGATNLGPALALYQPNVFGTVDSTLLIHGLPALVLLDGKRFPINSELGRMGLTPLDLFPIALLNAVDVSKDGAQPRYGTDAPGGLIDLRLNRTYTGGEMGVFYGKSGGKYGREDKSAYIIGTVGNDKVQFTAGAIYQESSGRVPRFGR